MHILRKLARIHEEVMMIKDYRLLTELHHTIAVKVLEK